MPVATNMPAVAPVRAKATTRMCGMKRRILMTTLANKIAQIAEQASKAIVKIA
jgi:hypothetical protein